MKKTRAHRSAAGWAAAGSFLVAFLVAAALQHDAPAETPTAKLRLVHAAAKTGPLALWIDGKKAASPAVTFKKTGPWLTMPFGGRKIEVFPTKGPAKTTALFSLDAFLVEDGSATVIICNPPAADPNAALLVHDRMPAPASLAMVRLFQAAEGFETADAYLDGGAEVGDNVGYGTATAYVKSAPGKWSMVVKSGPDTITFPPYVLEAGQHYTFVALGDDVHREALLLKD